MSPERQKAYEAVIIGCRWVVDNLKEISATDLKELIEMRKKYQSSPEFAKDQGNEAAKRSGLEMTKLLELILEFRGKLIEAEPTVEDQAEAAKYAEEMFRDR